MMEMQEEWFWSWRDGVGVWASGRYLYLDMRDIHDENEEFVPSILIPRRTRIPLAPDDLIRRFISKILIRSVCPVTTRSSSVG
jgi:hypothetical protein